MFWPILILVLSWVSMAALVPLLRVPRHAAHKHLPAPEVMWVEPEITLEHGPVPMPTYPDFSGFA